MNLWALSELNELDFHAGATIDDCWVEQVLAAFLFGKQSLKTAKNSILKGVRRHPCDAKLVRYGDIHKAREMIDGEETVTE